jgi:hypothetical protein
LAKEGTIEGQEEKSKKAQEADGTQRLEGLEREEQVMKAAFSKAVAATDHNP